MGGRHSSRALGLGVLGALLLNSASAQTTPQVLSTAEPDLGVLDRQRPEYDAKGIPLGGFRMFPSVSATESYDDNVFRLPDASPDWYLTVSPEVDIKSEWGRHFLGLFARADIYNYAKYDSENLTDWAAGGAARYDISHAAVLDAKASYGKYHELWSSPDTAGNQASPNRFNQTSIVASVTFQPSALGFGAGGSFYRFEWKNTPLIGGGAIDNQDRNEDKYEGWLRVFYEFSPGYAVFARATYNDRKFDVLLDRTGADRASHGYRYDGGLNLVVSHLVRGEFYFGYLSQHFADNPARPLTNIAGFDYGLQFDWFVTPMLTLHAGGNRQLADTTFAGVSAEDAKRIDVSADYEVLRNLIAVGRVSFVATDYAGSAASDNSFSTGLKLEYLINRYAAAHFEYVYERRTSNRALAEYTDNTISIGLTLHV